jgi:short subunit dehydrogenase-like uncharacterized protein
MRGYDIVLFGASGFTGRQAAAYFARHAGGDLRWAIAGRNRDKLRGLGIGADIIVADSADQSSIDAMVRQARVVVSTAGPFARYGTPVVDACVRLGTDYVDITGETFWVGQLVERYHAQAESSRIRIVPCCGFDSVPSDVGAWLLAAQRGASTVRAYFQIGGGGLNGGTIASVSNMVATRQARDIARKDVLPFPHRDDWIGTWVGPFFMAPTNTWVVRRSASLFAAWRQPYPIGFTYREFLKYDPPAAAAKSIAASAAIGMFGLTLAVPPLFRVVERLLPTPGTGPSEAAMDRGWFSCTLIGVTATGARVQARIRNQGDAGNRSTVKMVCESALCLAYRQCSERGGILTPATAFGDHLVRRLRDAAFTIALDS